MLDRFFSNMHRQERGLEILFQLLEEEFSLLSGRQPQAVTSIELSLQELLRQLAVERLCLKVMVQELVPEAKKLREIGPAIDSESFQRLNDSLIRIEVLEQHCAEQAEKNAHLAFALAEQGQSMLNFMHDQVKPKSRNVYSQNGRYTESHPEAALFRGRS